MSSRKLVIDGDKQPVRDLQHILPDKLETLIILHPAARLPLDPVNNLADAEFVRSLAIKQDQPGVGRINAQNRVEVIFGTRRLRALRDWINVDPQRWGATEPRGYDLILRNTKDELEILDMMARENLDRAQPAVLQLAVTAALYEERGLPRKAIAARLKFRSPTRIAQILSLLQHTDRVKALINLGALKEAQARELLGCSAELIDDVCARIESGEKVGPILADVTATKRAAGSSKVRSRSEILRELDKRKHDPRIFNLICWMNGDPTVSLDEIIPPSKAVA